MNRFFNPDNFLWRGFARLADFIFLSCCFFLCSIPLVTIPAAAIALYDAVAHCLYGDEGHPYGRFFRTFKSEFLRGVGIALVWSVLVFLLSIGYQILYQRALADTALAIYATIYYFSLFIPVAIFCWLIPVESRFVYKFAQLHKMALYFTFTHLPSTVAVVALGLVTFEICVNMPFMLILLPGFCAYFQSLFIERVFKKYIPAEESGPAEDTEIENPGA